MPSGRSKGAIGIDRRSTIAGHKVRQRKLPVAVKNAIGDFMRVEVDNCDFKSLTEVGQGHILLYICIIVI